MNDCKSQCSKLKINKNNNYYNNSDYKYIIGNMWDIA